MDLQEMCKWSDRYFQLCLSIISRPSFSSYGQSSPINIKDVMKKADRMIEELKVRDQKFFTKNDNDCLCQNNHLS